MPAVVALSLQTLQFYSKKFNIVLLCNSINQFSTSAVDS